MDNTVFDKIFTRRTFLEDVEIFDLIAHEDKYYRVVIVNYLNEKKVSIKTNVNEYSNEPLFQYKSDDELLNALFIQVKFLFDNLVAEEYNLREEDFDLEVEVIDASELIKNFEMSTAQLEYFVEDNKLMDRYENIDKLQDENKALFDDLEEIQKDNIRFMQMLDEVFLSENIYRQLMDEDNSNKLLS